MEHGDAKKPRKKRDPRTNISKEQTEVLMGVYQKQQKPSKEDRDALAEQLGLTSRVVQVEQSLFSLYLSNSTN